MDHKSIKINHLGCGNLLRHVKDMVNNLLTYVQIMILFNPCNHEMFICNDSRTGDIVSCLQSGLVGSGKLVWNPHLGSSPPKKNLQLKMVKRIIYINLLRFGPKL